MSCHSVVVYALETGSGFHNLAFPRKRVKYSTFTGHVTRFIILFGGGQIGHAKQTLAKSTRVRTKITLL